MNMETWRSVVGWNGYEVSSSGQMRSWKVCRRSPRDTLPRLLAVWRLPNGYDVVTLKEPGRRENVYVHHAVMAAFVGPRPDGMEIAHGDGDRTHNALTNLRYATPKENSMDAIRHGTTGAGERHYAASLTDAAAAALRGFAGTHTEAARAFGVRYGVAYRIRTRRTWTRL